VNAKMPAPKDSVKLAEFKRKQSEILKRRLSDPAEFGRMYAWHNDKEKVKQQIAKATAWEKDKRKVKQAMEKRSRNLQWLESQKKNHQKFTEWIKNQSPEQRSEHVRSVHRLHPNQARQNAIKAWSNPEVVKLANLKRSATQKKQFQDPKYRQQRLSKMHSPEAIAKRVPQLSGNNSAAKRPEVRHKMSLSHSGKPRNLSPEDRVKISKRMRQFQLSHPNRVFQNTGIEVMVQGQLRKSGIPFMTHEALLGICIPDIIIKSAKIAIFCDGCFYHSCPQHCSNQNSSIPLKAIGRDARQNNVLLANGWIPLRFWEHEINGNIDSVIEEIVLCYMQRHVQPLLNNL
jgi:DNA mismatch endonuclease (patch repair protein)